MTGRRLASRFVAALLLAAGASGCWLQPGFDASHTNWNRDDTAITPDNVDQLVELWDTVVDSNAFLSHPISESGRLVVSTHTDKVVALEAATGEILWCSPSRRISWHG